MKIRTELASVVALLAAGCQTAATQEGDQPPSCAGQSHCITTVIGTGYEAFGDEGIPGWQSPTYWPQDGVVGPNGLLYYIDWNNHRIRSWDPKTQLTATIVGTGELGDLGGGEPALESHLNHPTGLAFAPNGDLIIAAWHNSKIKRVNMATGVLEDICGTGARAYVGDGVVGGAKKAKMDLPSSIAFDAKGTMFISDQANERIRAVDSQDTITTVVGDLWWTDNKRHDGKACTDASGNYTNCGAKVLVSKDKAVWVYDSATDTAGHASLDSAGAPIPYTGLIPIPDLGGGYSGDGGPAATAHIQSPKSQSAEPAGRLALDATRNLLYIADTGNNCVRIVDLTTGVIDTFAGTCGADKGGYSGDGGDAKSAQLNVPSDVDLFGDGSLLITDTMNDCVRKVSGGKITTFAGQCGKIGFAGDGSDASQALLNRPFGATVAPDGTVYVYDTHNNRVRVVVP